MKILKVVLHLFIAAALTTITQIGGVIYLVVIIGFRTKKLKYLYFLVAYVIVSLFIIPPVAEIFGREKIKNNNYLKPQSIFYTLSNRNYVEPKLNILLQKVSTDLNDAYPGTKLVYLDANFPFFNGFPLLPHLSHNDGKKVDISLLYEENGVISNKKPSISGYGVFEAPTRSEKNQTSICKNRGNWQYDLTKYSHFGKINTEISFSSKGTEYLMKQILKQPQLQKVFIEPHLKTRMNLLHSKIRFHGCQAVRHDDHIHIQIK